MNTPTTFTNWVRPLALLLIGCFGLLPTTRALNPPPEGGYPGGNTAEGQNALAILDPALGTYNTAVGFDSLATLITGDFNTALGAGALLLNNASQNTATGAAALFSNTYGLFNTANGAFALFSNSTGAQNTALGTSALQNNNGDNNTATGAYALISNTTGGNNTAVGVAALSSNTTGDFNTAVGDAALYSNTIGSGNTAIGANTPLGHNTTANNNTAVGSAALANNLTGESNNAFGTSALSGNFSGNSNNAVGYAALSSNQAGDNNNAFGYTALEANVTGEKNTAIGDGALANSTGDLNTALGYGAGGTLTAGNGNVYIGTTGLGAESNHTYIANIFTTSVNGGSTDSVTVDLSSGLLGHASSSRRYKEDIKSMDNASEAVYRLRPVTYRYKKEIDRSGSVDYGLIAEDVAEIDPNLAVRNREGQIESVRYNAINAMLLNEFLKEHKVFIDEHRKVEEQAAEIARQHKQIDALTAGLQKVSAQLEASKLTPQVVANAQ